MHGKRRRRRSPLKGIWDTKETTPSITKPKENVEMDKAKYMASQEKSNAIAIKGHGRHDVIKEYEYFNHLIQNDKIKKIDELFEYA